MKQAVGKLTPEYIINTVKTEYMSNAWLHSCEILSVSNSKHCARFLLKKYTSLSKKQIAELTSCKTYQSVTYSLSKHLELIQTDKNYFLIFDSILNLLTK